ncbi:MAG: bifunctional DNA primase/polymerase [Clostridia bacterium]|nr:bifunctional DNA primase/polymerase [Clostridia bacterium]
MASEVSISQFAYEYYKQGFAIIPVARSKKPLVRWEELQHRKPTSEEITAWWRRWPKANIGLLTGEINQLIVLDADGREGLATLRGKPLPPTPCARTGGGGLHYYFRHPGYPVQNFVRKLPGLDFRGDGGYVLAPPSLHPSGKRYEWVTGLALFEIELAPLPAWLVAILKPERPQGLSRSVEDWRKLVSEGVTEGQRNNSIAALAGHLLRKYVDPWVVLELCLAWNQVKCRPPLDDDEIVTTVDSVARLEAKRRQREARQDA